MPYKLRKIGKGYKVASPNRTFSKEPMTLRMAKRQMRAIYAQTKGK
jgi:hypothetical protein